MLAAHERSEYRSCFPELGLGNATVLAMNSVFTSALHPAATGVRQKELGGKLKRQQKYQQRNGQNIWRTVLGSSRAPCYQRD